MVLEIFAYSLLLGLPETLPHYPEIQSETIKFLQHVNSAVLISDNLSAWDDIRFPFPLSIRNFNATGDKNVERAYIIDARGQNIFYENLSTLPRNSETRFVFIITEENKSMLESPYFCHVLFLMIVDNDLTITISVDDCKGIGSKRAKGHNCQANVTFLDLPPNVIFNGKELDGTEGKILQTAANHLGFNLTYVSRPETGWGHFIPPSGLQGDIATGSSILAIGGLYAFLERYRFADFIFGEAEAVLAWATPLGVGPSKPTWYIILVTELSPTVWIVTFFTYASLIPIASFSTLNRNERSSVLLNILGLILGCPQKIILKRGLCFNVLMFGFLLTSYYRTMMSSKLTVPAPIPAIHTAEELVESGLELSGPRTALSYVKNVANASPENAAKAAIAAKFQPSVIDLSTILSRIAEEKTAAYLRHQDYMYYHSEKDQRTAGKIHIVEEPFSTYYCTTMVPKHSCLLARFQGAYQLLREAGFSSKWIKDWTSHRKPANANAPRKLAFEHVKGMLFLLLFGWIVSIVTFVTEQVFFNVSRRKNRNK